MRIKNHQNILGHETKKSKCVMSQEFWKPTKITGRFLFGWVLGQESWNPKYFVGKESYNPNYFVNKEPENPQTGDGFFSGGFFYTIILFVG